MKFPRQTVAIGECIAVLMRDGEVFLLDKYKRVNFEGAHWLAHRLSFHLNIKETSIGPCSKDDLVLHSCDNKWCVNPVHLSKGNFSRNSKEAWDRMDPEAKRRHKEKMEALASDPNYRARMREATRGIKKTEEHKKKIGDKSRGRVHTTETRRKMSIAAKNRRRKFV